MSGKDECFDHVSKSKHDRPNAYELKFLRSWFERPKMGDFPILSRDQHAWSAANEKDLIAIQPRQSADPFSRFFIYSFVPYFHAGIGRYFKVISLWSTYLKITLTLAQKPIVEDPESGITQYSESHLARLVHILGIVFASILPITSIVVLYFVSDQLAKLGTVVAFTALFSLALVSVTRAKRVEIFTATSA
jgi:hypothetical protein